MRNLRSTTTVKSAQSNEDQAQLKKKNKTKAPKEIIKIKAEIN